MSALPKGRGYIDLAKLGITSIVLLPFEFFFSRIPLPASPVINLAILPLFLFHFSGGAKTTLVGFLFALGNMAMSSFWFASSVLFISFLFSLRQVQISYLRVALLAFLLTAIKGAIEGAGAPSLALALKIAFSSLLTSGLSLFVFLFVRSFERGRRIEV